MSATSSADGAVNLPVGVGPPRKSASNFADPVAAELDVTRGDAAVRRRLRATAEPMHEDVGDGPRLTFGDRPDPRHGRARDVADGVHVRELRRERCRIDRDPAVDGQTRGEHDLGADVHGDAEEQVVRDRATVGE